MDHTRACYHNIRKYENDATFSILHRRIITLLDRDKSFISGLKNYLWVTLLQIKQLIFPRLGAPAGPERSCGTHRGQVFPIAVLEGQLAGFELQREAGGVAVLLHQFAIIAEEAAVARLQAVLAVHVHQGDQRVHPPGDVAVHWDLSLWRWQVGIALPCHAEQAGLWVQGQVHGPQLLLPNDLGETGQVVGRASEVALERLWLQCPASVGLGHDKEATLRIRLLCSTCDLPIFVRGQVASQVAAEEHHLTVLLVLLQGPDLLLLQADARGVHLEAESLSRQVAVPMVD